MTESFAANLRLIRKELGFSQTVLAKKMGISPALGRSTAKGIDTGEMVEARMKVSTRKPQLASGEGTESK